MLAAFDSAAFRWFFAGLFCSMFSYAAQNLARGYLAFDLTGSSAAASVVVASWGVPMIAVGLFAGVIADRLPKQRILLVTQSTLGMCAFITGVLVQIGAIELWHLIALGLLQGAAFGFNIPTRQAMLPELVSERAITNAVALTNAGSALASIIGPAIGGVLVVLAFVGVAGVMYLSALLYVIVLVTYARLPSRAIAGPSGKSIMGDLAAGLAYVRGDRAVLVLMILAFVMATFGQPYQYSLPAFVVGALAAGADELGVLMSAIGVGSLTGSLVVARSGNPTWRGRTQIAAGVMFSLALFAFSLSPWIWVSAILLFVAGAATTSYLSLNQAALVEATIPAFRGRVISISSLMTAIGSMAILPYGLLMDVIGFRETFAGGAVLMLVCVLVTAALVPAIWRSPVPLPAAAKVG